MLEVKELKKRKNLRCNKKDILNFLSFSKILLFSMLEVLCSFSVKAKRSLKVSWDLPLDLICHWSLSSMSIKINSKCNSILSILTYSTVVITFLLFTSLNETEDAISILLGKSFIVDSGEFLMQVNNSHDRKGTRFLLKSLWWETCWSCLLISFWLDFF